jgi:probable phosphoglycerate mutase
MLPTEWAENSIAYDTEKWYQHYAYEDGILEESVRSVYDGLDEVLKNHGYYREGKLYKTAQGHDKTIAFFCHFGLEMLLLSRLFNASPIPLWQHFTALTSSVTTVYTEERRKGIVSFRCAGFGDTGHLYAGGETPSFAARFCEVYGNGDRED